MKKILYVLPVVALLAAGCGSSNDTTSQSSNQSNTDQSQNSTSQNEPTPTPSVTPSDTMMMMNQGSGGWQGTLMTSDNAAKGSYKITTGGHTVYIKTSRDFSALVGKNVNVKYSGTMDSFSLTDIVAQ